MARIYVELGQILNEYEDKHFVLGGMLMLGVGKDKLWKYNYTMGV